MVEPAPAPVGLLPLCYWVRPGRLLAGEYPGDPNAAQARLKLRALLDAGINHLVDLTHPGNVQEPYAALLQEEAAALGLEVERHAAPIRDYEVPNPLQLRAILEHIDAALAQGRNVYVHCLGGRGRTGTVVGAWLVRHGLTGEEALGRIAEALQGTASQQAHSPETDEQRALVLAWQEYE